MEDLSLTTWGFIFSMSGILFGWMLNQIGQWINGKQQDKRALKVVLFNLLELYFIFSRFNLDEFTEALINRVHSKMPDELRSDGFKALMQQAYTQMLKEIFLPELKKDLEKVSDNYEASVRDLAIYYPVTAYLLSKRPDPMIFIDKVEQSINQWRDSYDPNQFDKEKNETLKILKPDMLESTLKTIEVDIRKVAWRIDFYSWWKSTEVIKKVNRRADEILGKEIDELFEKLQPVLDDAVNTKKGL